MMYTRKKEDLFLFHASSSKFIVNDVPTNSILSTFILNDVLNIVETFRNISRGIGVYIHN